MGTLLGSERPINILGLRNKQWFAPERNCAALDESAVMSNVSFWKRLFGLGESEKTSARSGYGVTNDELLALADYFEERADRRAETARTINDPTDIDQLLQLLTESDRHEAACAFAERALAREREHGREPEPSLWAAIEAKRAWLRGEINDNELEAAQWAARDAAGEPLPIASGQSHSLAVAAQKAASAAAEAAAQEVDDACWAAAVNAEAEAAWVAAHAAVFGARATEPGAICDVLGNAEEKIDALEWEENEAERQWQGNWIMKKAWGGERPMT
ncbi:MAG: hypothetical protein ACYSWU_12835 [Planctomycetota bacterium]